MKQYAVVMTITMVMAWIEERTYVVAPNSLATKRKDHVSFLVIFLVLSLFIGLRTHYNDTYTYRMSYRAAQPFPEAWNTLSFSLADHPGFEIVKSVLKTCKATEYSFILICSLFSVFCMIWFFRRYSSNLLLSFFLFFSTNTYLISAAAIKQAIAIGIALCAIPFALKKKKFQFLCLILIAATFHPYVLFFLLVPFLTFQPWSKWTYVMITSFVICGFLLESLLGTLVDITSMIGEIHEEEQFIGEGINIFRVLVSNVPLLLTFLYRKRIFNNSTWADHLVINLAMLNGAIMFVGMFGTAIYFSRMASYFTIAQCVALPWIIEKLNRNEQYFYKASMVGGYTLFFIYQNMISQSFDVNFSRMTVVQYLGILAN